MMPAPAKRNAPRRSSSFHGGRSLRTVVQAAAPFLLLLLLRLDGAAAGKDKEIVPTLAPVAVVAPPAFAPVVLDPSNRPPPPPGEGVPTPAPSLSEPTASTTTDGGGGGSDEEGLYYSVALPLMRMTLGLRDASSSSSSNSSSPSLPSSTVLRSALVGFFQTFLSQSSAHRAYFREVDLNVTRLEEEQEPPTSSSVSSSTSSEKGGTSWWSLDCAGRAVFSKENGTASTNASDSVTSSEDLTKAIITYLSFWGLTDLREYLSEHAGWEVSEIAVAVNGDDVQPALDPEDGGGGGESGDGSSSSSQGAPSSGTPNRGAAAAAASVAAVAAVLLLAGAVWIVAARSRGRRRNLRRGGKLPGSGSDDGGGSDVGDLTTRESHSPPHSREVPGTPDSFDPHLQLRIVGPVASPTSSYASGSPSRCRPLSPTSLDGDDLASYSGVASVGVDSVFTSAAGTSASSSPERPFAYDASRLDHVILSARGFTERHGQEEQQRMRRASSDNAAASSPARSA